MVSGHIWWYSNKSSQEALLFCIILISLQAIASVLFWNSTHYHLIKFLMHIFINLLSPSLAIDFLERISIVFSAPALAPRTWGNPIMRFPERSNCHVEQTCREPAFTSLPPAALISAGFFHVGFEGLVTLFSIPSVMIPLKKVLMRCW